VHAAAGTARINLARINLAQISSAGAGKPGISLGRASPSAASIGEYH
jgi:hypothetical protein